MNIDFNLILNFMKKNKLISNNKTLLNILGADVVNKLNGSKLDKDNINNKIIKKYLQSSNITSLINLINRLTTNNNIKFTINNKNNFNIENNKNIKNNIKTNNKIDSFIKVLKLIKIIILKVKLLVKPLKYIKKTIIYKTKSNIIIQSINNNDLTNTKGKGDDKKEDEEKDKENVNDKDKPEINEIIILKSVEKCLDNIVVNEDNKQQGKSNDKETNQMMAEDNKNEPQKRNAEENNKTTGNEPMADISKNQNINSVKAGEIKGEMKVWVGGNSGMEEKETEAVIGEDEDAEDNDGPEIVKDDFEADGEWEALDLDKTEKIKYDFNNKEYKQNEKVPKTLPKWSEEKKHLKKLTSSLNVCLSEFEKQSKNHTLTNDNNPNGLL